MDQKAQYQGAIVDEQRMLRGKAQYALLDSLITAFADAVVERMNSERQGSASPARLMSVAQAAEYLGRTSEAVKHLISEGSLPTVRSDRRVFLNRFDLDRWIEDHKA